MHRRRTGPISAPRGRPGAELMADGLGGVGGMPTRDHAGIAAVKYKGTPGAGARGRSGGGSSSQRHGRPCQIESCTSKHPGHAGGNASPANNIAALGKQDGLQGGPRVAGEVLMLQTRLPQHGGIGSVHVGGLRGGGQLEELRDDAAHPGSSLGVTTAAAGSNRAGRVGGIRRGDAAGGILGSRTLAEELVLGLPGHLEEALGDLDRGIGISDRELEGILHHQPIPHAGQRSAAIVCGASPLPASPSGRRRRGMPGPWAWAWAS